ncbi:MAG: hypothetical protein MAG715_00887 [Methanonatronarchaeales archaeon]|nr:hypothetical protein [Methanonatronarchaeales archaeon]
MERLPRLKIYSQKIWLPTSLLATLALVLLFVPAVSAAGTPNYPGGMTFAGNGDRVIDGISLTEGDLSVRIEHSTGAENSYFSVNLYQDNDLDGIYVSEWTADGIVVSDDVPVSDLFHAAYEDAQSVDSVVNTTSIGGKARLEVEAEGEWRVTLEEHPRPMHSIEGRVVPGNGSDGDLLDSNATVVAVSPEGERYESETNNYGSFAVDVYGFTNYTLTADAPGYVPSSRGVTVSRQDFLDLGYPSWAVDIGTIRLGEEVEEADIEVEVHGPAGALAGVTIDYSVELKNKGPSDATNVVVLHQTGVYGRAGDVEVIDTSSSGGSSVVQKGGSIRSVEWVVPRLDSGETTTLETRLRISNVTEKATVSSEATMVMSDVSFEGPVLWNDPNSGNNVDSVETDIALVRVSEETETSAEMEKPEEFEVTVDPASTYLRTSGESAGDALPISLQERGIEPGDVITVERIGTWGTGSGEEGRGVIGVFSATDEVMGPEEVNRVPGAVDAGLEVETGLTWFGERSTDIPEDFSVADSEGTRNRVTVTVPEGARYLFVAANDVLYEDNSGSFTIRVTVKKSGEEATGTPGFGTPVSMAALMAAAAALARTRRRRRGDSR